jgi:signal transduction histidine kinase
MRLYWRIVLPFAVGLVVIMGAAAATATYLLSRQAEQRLAQHLEVVAERLAAAGFELNQPLVERIKLAVGAEVVVLSGDRIAVATLPAAAVPDALRALGTPPSGAPERLGRVGGRRYMIVARPLPDQLPGTLALLAPLAPLEADRAGIARTLGLVSLAGLVLMLAVGHLITRSLTRPIGQLVDSTQAVAGGRLDVRTPRGDVRELSTLAAAFDDMVTKIRESEERLRRTERLAATGQIVATVAHEVRNPLAAIRMMTQLLAPHHAEGTQAHEACRKILTEIDRLDLLVTGLLGATQPHAPRAWQPIHLGRLTRDVLSVIGAQLAHRGIQVEVDAPPDLPSVRADADGLKQVVWNLVLNAADVMPGGGPLRIEARPSARGPIPGVELSVTDGGSGVPGDAGRRVFEPFFSTKPEGVGLGLALCERVIAEHEGSISLENRAGGGAVARIWLPSTGEAETPWPAS